MSAGAGLTPAEAETLRAGRGCSRDHIYLHIPFCERRCPYCDFSVVVGHGADTGAFLAALDREGELLQRAGIGAGSASAPDPTPGQALQPHTLYLGGGTPSWLAPVDLAHLLTSLNRRWGEARAESTCEMNPEHADDERLAVLREGGITRISLGVQSFSPGVLRRLGRVHTASEAAAAAERIVGAGFTLAIDLIFGVPGQTTAQWRSDLDSALALAPDHLSLYGLTWEEGTLFARWRERGRLHEPGDDWMASASELALERLREAGYERYEVSNFARPGAEAVHNRAYWTGADWIGLGPSAHSHFDGLRIAGESDLERWQAMVLDDGCLPWAGIEDLDDLARTRERILLGLRLAEGIDLNEVGEHWRAGILENAGEAEERGLIMRDGSRLRLTDAGFLLADELAVRLAP